MPAATPDCKPQVLHVIAASVSPHADGRALLVRLSEGGAVRLVFSENLSAQIAAELAARPLNLDAALSAKSVQRRRGQRGPDAYSARLAASDAKYSRVLALLADPANTGRSESEICRELGLRPNSFFAWRHHRAKRKAAA